MWVDESYILVWVGHTKWQIFSIKHQMTGYFMILIRRTISYTCKWYTITEHILVNIGIMSRNMEYLQNILSLWGFFKDFRKYWQFFKANGLFPSEVLAFPFHLVTFERRKNIGKCRKTVLKDGKQTQICALPASFRPNTGSQLGPLLAGIGGGLPPFHQIR